MPEWAQPYAYIATKEKFFNTNNGVELSVGSFHLTYGRFMPVTETGRRENAAERCLHFWGMPIVERIGYRPDCPAFYRWMVSASRTSLPTSLPDTA